MPLKYKVVSLKYPQAEIYIEAQKVIAQLSFEDYLKEVVDPHVTRCLDKDTNSWAFHPERSYAKVEQYNDVFRIETGELRLVNKEHQIKVGDYIRYDPATDEMALWDAEAAKQTSNLILVQS